jgi:hypothetical protein
MRSSVESRNAPNGVPLPDERAKRPSSVSMIDPTMNATPARTQSSWVTSTAAATFSTRPVIEILLGVSRDSISRSIA